MIRFYNSLDDLKAKKPVAPADATDWDTVRTRHFLRFRSGSNTAFDGVDNTITINSSLKETLETQYAQYMSSKRKAMQYGNAAAEVGDDVTFHFAKGFEGAYYKKNGSPYLQTLNNIPPEDREFNFLTDRTTALTASTNDITFIFDGRMCDICSTLEELNAYAWLLYHYVNRQAHRIFKYDPAHRFLGSLPSYQATIAKYNHLIWVLSYIAHYSTLRESLSFEMGYACTLCDLGGVMTITATITPINEHKPAKYQESSLAFLLIYKMNESQVASDEVKAQTKVTITKTLKNGTTQTESGYGNEKVNDGFDKEQDSYTPQSAWSKYEVKVEIPSMHQGESYRGMFSLARAIYDQTQLSIPRADYYSNQGDGKIPTHTLKLEIEWKVGEGTDNVIKRTFETIEIVALDWPDQDTLDNDVLPSSTISLTGADLPPELLYETTNDGLTIEYLDNLEESSDATD